MTCPLVNLKRASNFTNPSVSKCVCRKKGKAVAFSTNNGTGNGNVSLPRDSQAHHLIPTSQVPTPPLAGEGSLWATFSWPEALAGPSEVAVAGSFNAWQTPIPLRRAGGGDFVRSVVLPPGQVTYKFIVDGDWHHSPRDPVYCRTIEDSPNNRRTVVANARFTWSGAHEAADSVFVTGSFLNWQELIPLARDAAGNHNVSCCLPAGKHFVQFLVDGEWFVSPDLPQDVDETGRVCNSIQVDLRGTFHLFYRTDWPEPVLRWRHLRPDDQVAVTGWEKTPLSRSQSRRANWLGCSVPALRDEGGAPLPSLLEFVVEGPEGAEDRAFGGSSYWLSGTGGGFKLEAGVIKPFIQACSPPIMLVSDLDGTMVGEGREADAATAAFTEYWEAVAALCQSVLVYNTGRSIGQFTGLYQSKRNCMAMPDAVITAVGTKVFFLGPGTTRLTADGTSWVEDKEYARQLSQDWDLETVRAAAGGAVNTFSDTSWLDDGSEHPHRVALMVHSRDVPNVTAHITAEVERAGFRAQFIVSGAGDFRYLDVLSIHGGKMAALEYVRRVYDIKQERVVTAGDSGNDILMLEGANPAIVVGNAQPALLEWAAQQQQSNGRVVLSDKHLALGILEGLARHGLY